MSRSSSSSRRSSSSRSRPSSTSGRRRASIRHPGRRSSAAGPRFGFPARRSRGPSRRRNSPVAQQQQRRLRPAVRPADPPPWRPSSAAVRPPARRSSSSSRPSSSPPVQPLSWEGEQLPVAAAAPACCLSRPRAVPSVHSRRRGSPAPSRRRGPLFAARCGGLSVVRPPARSVPVSYTHLTLPTTSRV